jgi:hypothetical protein
MRSTTSHPISLRYSLILPSYLWLGLQVLRTEFCTHFSSLRCVLHAPLILLDLISRNINLHRKWTTNYFYFFGYHGLALWNATIQELLGGQSALRKASSCIEHNIERGRYIYARSENRNLVRVFK